MNRRQFMMMTAAGLSAAAFPGSALAQAQVEDVTTLSIARAAALVKARRVSSVELTNACLARIATLQPSLNAFITVTADAAVRQARAADAEIANGKYRGPLHGIPIALKDNIDTVGVRTTAASALFADRVPVADAEVARRLKEAGAVLVGKTNMDEFADRGSGVDSYWGPVHNPWALEREAGGSSAGSAAAVAADLCFAALGTDTGGSIRVPASHCSVVGLKPTYGRVSNRGVIPACWSYDHTGPITKTVEDAALVLRIIAGYDEADIGSVDMPVLEYEAAVHQPVTRIRVGIPRAFFFDALEEEVHAVIDAALKQLVPMVGTVSDITLPQVMDLYDLRDAEFYAFHRAMYERAPGMYLPATGRDIRDAAETKGHLVAEGRRVLELRRREVGKLFESVDVIVMPTVKYAPRTIAYWRDRIDTPKARPPGTWNTWLFNVFGLPAMSVPAGFTKDGLPVGLMIAAGPWRESHVLSVGAAFERATEWHTRKPPQASR